jgi:hypothetical protein
MQAAGQLPTASFLSGRSCPRAHARSTHCGIRYLSEWGDRHDEVVLCHGMFIMAVADTLAPFAALWRSRSMRVATATRMVRRLWGATSSTS